MPAARSTGRDCDLCPDGAPQGLAAVTAYADAEGVHVQMIQPRDARGGRLRGPA